MARILIVDDEVKLGRLLVEMLEGHGYEVARVRSGKEALDRLRAEPFDLVITDLRMPDVDGMQVLRGARALHPGTDVILMTAYATTPNAVEAMKDGAADYLIKPFAMDELRLRVARVLDKRRVVARADALARRLEAQEGFVRVIARSERMRRVVNEARRVAATDETVLLTGESGTGKTMVARAIHHASRRADGPFVEVSPALLPDALIESELFGHEKGAYTGAHDSKPGHVELAGGGTLFLDEIGELSAATQVKLLQFLQDRAFTRLGSTQIRRADVRVVAATNRDLKAALRAGTFRDDLYYRLSVFPIEVPPLRARPEDIPALVADALGRRGLGPDRVTDDALAAMSRHPWPGNVRELENVVARSIILAGGEPVRAEHLPPALRGDGPSADILDDLLIPGFRLDALERDLIHHAIVKAGSNKAAAARMLGITRRRLYSRLASLDEEADRDADDEAP